MDTDTASNRGLRIATFVASAAGGLIVVYLLGPLLGMTVANLILTAIVVTAFVSPATLKVGGASERQKRTNTIVLRVVLTICCALMWLIIIALIALMDNR